MTEYEKLLDKMHFTIGSTLMDNDFCRKGLGGVQPQPESEILRSNRRTFVELKVMMMRLERALYGEKNYEEDETEISNRNTSTGEDTSATETTSRPSRVGNFSC